MSAWELLESRKTETQVLGLLMFAKKINDAEGSQTALSAEGKDAALRRVYKALGVAFFEETLVISDIEPRKGLCRAAWTVLHALVSVPDIAMDFFAHADFLETVNAMIPDDFKDEDLARVIVLTFSLLTMTAPPQHASRVAPMTEAVANKFQHLASCGSLQDDFVAALSSFGAHGGNFQFMGCHVPLFMRVISCMQCLSDISGLSQLAQQLLHVLNFHWDHESTSSYFHSHRLQKSVCKSLAMMLSSKAPSDVRGVAVWMIVNRLMQNLQFDWIFNPNALRDGDGGQVLLLLARLSLNGISMQIDAVCSSSPSIRKDEARMLLTLQGRVFMAIMQFVLMLDLEGEDHTLPMPAQCAIDMMPLFNDSLSLFVDLLQWYQSASESDVHDFEECIAPALMRLSLSSDGVDWKSFSPLLHRLLASLTAESATDWALLVLFRIAINLGPKQFAKACSSLRKDNVFVRLLDRCLLHLDAESNEEPQLSTVARLVLTLLVAAPSAITMFRERPTVAKSLGEACKETHDFAVITLWNAVRDALQRSSKHFEEAGLVLRNAQENALENAEHEDLTLIEDVMEVYFLRR
jgi:hypothetical protein